MNNNEKKINIRNYFYQAVIGTGGIGSGIFLALNGNQTLGREESRAVQILDQHDYCKLHIILHYVKTLLGEQFPVIPVGKVGNDEVGVQLIGEMQAIGLDMRYVEKCQDVNTTFSYSFLYPNGEGGNLTVDDSASSRVDEAAIRHIEPEFALYKDKCIALAVPEVSIEARNEFLSLASSYKSFRIASFLSGEINKAFDLNLIGRIDLLSINLDEAAMILNMSYDSTLFDKILERALEKILSLNPEMLVSITGGEKGSWSWDGNKLVHLPAINIDVVSTAGAGDAFLAGLIIGLVDGLEFTKAQEFANLIASMSVTSQHTIHPGITKASLNNFVTKYHPQLSWSVRSLIS